VVCGVEELPEGTHIIAEVGARLSIGVYNIQGRFVAVRNYCPHAGAPVCEGVLTGAIVSDGVYERHVAHVGQILKCPWHAWEFKLPEGTTITEPAYRLKTYPVTVEAGKVIVDLGYGTQSHGKGGEDS
jgi:nitrite reductase (NADH) small subunit